MLTASLIGTALAIAVVLGSAITAYLWLVRRHRIETVTGIQALAAMRWREFSHFVVEALRGRGFELDQEASQPQKSDQAELLLRLNGKPWLLGCKQGVDQVIGAPQAADLARSVRQTGSVGGILATLGKVDPAAAGTSQNVELLDGGTLWRLIRPLLPASLQEHLAERSRHDTLRSIELSWVGALLVGFAIAVALMPEQAPLEDRIDAADAAAPEPAPRAPAPIAAVPPPTAAVAAAPDPVPAAALDPAVPTQAPVGPVPVPVPAPAPAPAPATEAERREEAMRAVSAVQGVQSAVWASRSTLLVYLEKAEADQDLVARLCRSLETYEELAASRLQLQPPAGSAAVVRFRQCRVY
ncbi:MAG: restriction endonuclease [Pseudomonadota bacterium]|nr:restriction endonuclease [Pseudomonadota bacterium]